MAIKDVFKVSRKTFINPSAWLGIPEIKDHTRTIWQLVRGLFVAPQAVYNETFEEALVRMKLTEEDIKNQAESFFIYSVVFATLCVVSFVFAFYLLFVDRSFSGCLLGMAVTALFGAQAVRYNFWVFQIQQRRLGCTLEEWKRSFFNASPGPDA